MNLIWSANIDDFNIFTKFTYYLVLCPPEQKGRYFLSSNGYFHSSITAYTAKSAISDIQICVYRFINHVSSVAA